MLLHHGVVAAGSGEDNRERTKSMSSFGNDPRLLSVELFDNIECVGLKFELTPDHHWGQD
ncbi:hypothetical protein GCM10009764_32650 [Nocardia ninae]|uniref:Uncharacterized protein n=1 Tax=Nocardia ninae NBRC 108245 TaxID=1210091 RepID=A0A511MTK8_9NOCA|nr:hypothetical protein NN4_79150 [Nocardia ninae NBRC 108245]